MTSIGGGGGADDNGTGNNGGSGGGAGGGGGGVRGEGTSTDTTPTNVQAGSRLEETDTRKIYYRDDVDFKELDGNEATNYRSASWYEQLSGETP